MYVVANCVYTWKDYGRIINGKLSDAAIKTLLLGYEGAHICKTMDNGKVSNHNVGISTCLPKFAT